MGLGVSGGMSEGYQCFSALWGFGSRLALISIVYELKCSRVFGVAGLLEGAGDLVSSL